MRVRRLALASFTSFCVFILASYAIWQGLLPGIGYGQLALEIGLPVVFFYWLIRSGQSLHLRDSTLTLLQMLAATLINMHLVFLAHEARSVFLMVYLLIMVFGIAQLRVRQFLLLGLVTVLIYGILIVFQSRSSGTSINVSVEVLQWMVLAFIYPWFAVVGRYINDARHRLRETNDKLAAAMDDVEAAMTMIQEQATHDELTGIHNRRAIMAAIRTEKLRVERSGETFCILLIDIDHFKSVNDRLGHLGGDQVLILFARAVESQLRSIDRFGRFGGEEFILLLPDAVLAGALSGAERVRQSVAEKSFDDAGVGTRITVSIGVAEFSPGDTVEQLLTRADQALYRAKDSGRNCVIPELRSADVMQVA